MSAAILAGAPIAAAAVVGGLAWLVRVAVAVPRGPRKDRIDPFALGDPWRRMVADAQQARARFQRTVDKTHEGPLRERLAELGRRLDDAVNESWRVACQGDSLEGALRQLDTRNVELELAEAKAERKASRGRASESLDRTIAALEAQVSSAQRIAAVWRDARDRLRLLNAQLDEAVARAIELSVRAGDVSELSPLAEDVDSLVSELESLRQALEETGGTRTATA